MTATRHRPNLMPKVAVVLVIAALATAGCSSDAASTTTAAPTTTAPIVVGVDPQIPGVITYTGMSHVHTPDPVPYPQSPPVGGNHNPVWQNCGVYDQSLINEHAVHSLEHGAVWLAYRPGLPADDIARLAAFAANQTHVLVSPYPGLLNSVVATAWGAQLKLDSVTDPRLAKFVEKYQEGPTAREVGATCSGGFGEPIG